MKIYLCIFPLSFPLFITHSNPFPQEDVPGEHRRRGAEKGSGGWKGGRGGDVR